VCCFVRTRTKEWLLTQDVHNDLSNYAVNAANKQHEFWQRDSLAVHLYDRKIAYQKLDYIHANPTTEHWALVSDPCDYKYSTSKLYEMGVSEFDFVKDLREEY